MYLSLLSLLFITKDEGSAIATVAVIVIAAVILGWLLATRKRGGGFVLIEDFEAYKEQIQKEQKEQGKKIADLTLKVAGIKIPAAFDSSMLEKSINVLKGDHDKQIADLNVKVDGIKIPTAFDSSVLEKSINVLKEEHNKQITDLNVKVDGIKIPETFDSSILENSFSLLKGDHEKQMTDLNLKVDGIKIPDNSFDPSSLESSISSLRLGQEENDKALDEAAEALKSLEREKDILSSKEKALEADIILIKNENEKIKSENTKLWDAVNDCCKSKKEPEAPKSKEDAILDGIAAKRSLINFASIGEANENDKDDLKLIKGIGPFIEKKLNALGIWTFAQVGAFKPEDIESVTKAIEFFPGRISRDNWVPQANELKNK